jgi:hypothetical protein
LLRALTHAYAASSDAVVRRFGQIPEIITVMPDILIRDLSERTIAEIDRRASESGLSRNEYLRHWLDREIRPQVTVTDDDLERLSRLTTDLSDPDVMRQAWS